MKKFIIKILIFIGLFVFVQLGVIFFHYYVIGNQYGNVYTGIFPYKMERIASINEPKIILVGDSNVAYGFNSELIEKEFGMPVVNMGLHGGLGSKFHINMIRNNINQGDIVIYAGCGYGIENDIPDIRLAWITVEFYSQYYNQLFKGEELRLIKAYPNYFFNSFTEYLSKTGSHRGTLEELGFNIYGDVCKERPFLSENIYFTEGVVSIPYMSEDNKESFNNLNDYVESKGATLLIAGYPIGYAGDISDKQKKELRDCKEIFQEGLNCQIISNYDEYLFSYEYFYDSSLHLGTEGAELRTKILINDLKENDIIK